MIDIEDFREELIEYLLGMAFGLNNFAITFDIERVKKADEEELYEIANSYGFKYYKKR